jgi:hypothetical protein
MMFRTPGIACGPRGPAKARIGLEAQLDLGHARQRAQAGFDLFAKGLPVRGRRGRQRHVHRHLAGAHHYTADQIRRHQIGAEVRLHDARQHLHHVVLRHHRLPPAPGEPGRRSV